MGVMCRKRKREKEKEGGSCMGPNVNETAVHWGMVLALRLGVHAACPPPCLEGDSGAHRLPNVRLPCSTGCHGLAGAGLAELQLDALAWVHASGKQL